MAGPNLRDAYGKLTISAPKTAADNVYMGHGATSIVYDGDQLVGPYVDDTTPDRDAWARKLVALKPPMVIVSNAPGEPHHRCPGCVMLLEANAGDLNVPLSDGYIVWFDTLGGGQTPMIDRARQLVQLAARHPKMLWIL